MTSWVCLVLTARVFMLGRSRFRSIMTLGPMVATDLRVLPSMTARAILSVGTTEWSMVVANMATSSRV